MKARLIVVSMLAVFSVSVSSLLASPILTLDAPAKVKGNHNFEVTIGIERLTQGLGAFSFDFKFTPRDGIVFLPHATSFGDELGDVGSGEALVSITPIDVGLDIKKLQILELSLLFPLPAQPSDFTLLTLGFYAPGVTGAAGRTVGMILDNFLLSDELGSAIVSQNSQVGAFITVPEPSVLVLLLPGVLGLGVMRRTKMGG